MSQQITVARAIGNTRPHREKLKELGLIWDSENGWWYSKNLTEEERAKIKIFCSEVGLQYEEYSWRRNTEYKLQPF